MVNVIEQKTYYTAYFKISSSTYQNIHTANADIVGQNILGPTEHEKNYTHHPYELWFGCRPGGCYPNYYFSTISFTQFTANDLKIGYQYIHIYMYIYIYIYIHQRSIFDFPSEFEDKLCTWIIAYQ